MKSIRLNGVALIRDLFLKFYLQKILSHERVAYTICNSYLLQF